jgi:predicted nucleotidyltransferase
MTSEQVMARLREHEAELRKAGIVRLWLFGSTARGDRQPESDIDLLAAFDETRGLSLLDIAGLELRLAGLLGQPVDLVEEGTLKPRVQQSVEAEAQRAF